MSPLLRSILTALVLCSSSISLATTFTLHPRTPYKAAYTRKIRQIRGGEVGSFGATANQAATRLPATLARPDASSVDNSNGSPNGSPDSRNNNSNGQKPRVIFVLGGPGAGKGTQCAKIVEHFDFIHLSVGDLLRTERQNPSSPNGQLIESYLAEGKIVPVEISLGLVKSAMETYPEGSIFLIDGFPRSADNLDGWRRTMSEHVDTMCVLVYDCPMEELEKRILLRGETSGRSDDNLQSAKKRFHTFSTQTMPVVRTLESTGVNTVHIRGENTLEEVWSDTRKEITTLLAAELQKRNEELCSLSPDDFCRYVDPEILNDFAKSGKWNDPQGEVEVVGKTATLRGAEGTRVWELCTGNWMLIHFSTSAPVS
ncbi:hypothetical protein TrST_g10304 [Triparma strigata]|uniref:Uncharacterized protein n=1 Tax=Triparma strigata TaxID=1606541 RepID=A0A9W7ERM8_9STRA|nr:hypothetical protein TrST_g10304 [Triparma strigata]